MTDSSTGGYLLPTSPAPINDAALDQLFQTFISSITGLAPKYVRERFTAEPAPPPDYGSTWAAVGVMSIEDDQFAQQEMRPDDSYVLTRHEILDVMASFYGARAQEAARRARNGTLIAQNREVLEAAGLFFMSAAQPVKAPALIQNRWTNRIDVTFTFRRAIAETFAILPIASAQGTIADDGTAETTFDTTRS